MAEGPAANWRIFFWGGGVAKYFSGPKCPRRCCRDQNYHSIFEITYARFIFQQFSFIISAPEITAINWFAKYLV